MGQLTGVKSNKHFSTFSIKSLPLAECDHDFSKSSIRYKWQYFISVHSVSFLFWADHSGAFDLPLIPVICLAYLASQGEQEEAAAFPVVMLSQHQPSPFIFELSPLPRKDD